MGLSYRPFIATDAGISVVSQARWGRIHDGQEALPEYANRELRVLSVTVEVAGRLVLRPVSVLPYRVRVNGKGLIDRDALHVRAIHALDDYIGKVTIESEIAKLQRDASYFWVPSDEHWIALSRSLKLPVEALKSCLSI